MSEVHERFMSSWCGDRGCVGASMGALSLWEQGDEQCCERSGNEIREIHIEEKTQWNDSEFIVFNISHSPGSNKQLERCASICRNMAKAYLVITNEECYCLNKYKSSHFQTNQNNPNLISQYYPVFKTDICKSSTDINNSYKRCSIVKYEYLSLIIRSNCQL